MRCWYRMSRRSAGLLAIFCMLAAGSVASAVPLVATDRLGTWGWEGHQGALGYTSGTFAAEAPQIGLHFEGPSIVDSFTINQMDHNSRRRIEDITVYTSPTHSYEFTMARDQGPQTFSLPGVTTSYLLITVDSEYTTAGNSDKGIASITADGTPLGLDTNLNFGRPVTATGGLSGWTFPARVTDGVVRDAGTSKTTNNTATYFERNSGQDSLELTYADPTTVHVIGLGLDPQDDPDVMRDLPKFVTLEYDGGSQRLDLAGDKFQYGRYLLPTPITDTTFLRMVFPDGSVTNDWYLHENNDYGVTEFQAYYIPEPTTLLIWSLLAGLGVGLGWRRRK